MIRFILLEDTLIYKAKIKKSIEQAMAHESYQIEEFTKNTIYSSDLMVYIIDYDQENSTSLINQIEFKQNIYIIYLSQSNINPYSFFGQDLPIFDVIYKYTQFEKQIQKDILFLTKHFSKNLEHEFLDLENQNIKVPKKEIMELIILKDKILIQGKNINQENYTYIIDGSFSNIQSEFAEQFQCQNKNHFMTFRKGQLHLQVNLTLIRKKQYVKPYKDNQKQKILFLYHEGVKVRTISKLYSIPSRTIYNWIKNERFIEASKKAQKYDQIVKITKE